MSDRFSSGSGPCVPGECDRHPEHAPCDRGWIRLDHVCPCWSKRRGIEIHHTAPHRAHAKNTPMQVFGVGVAGQQTSQYRLVDVASSTANSASGSWAAGVHRRRSRNAMTMMRTKTMAPTLMYTVTPRLNRTRPPGRAVSA
jgi:hypothetical protein